MRFSGSICFKKNCGEIRCFPQLVCRVAPWFWACSGIYSSSIVCYLVVSKHLILPSLYTRQSSTRNYDRDNFTWLLNLHPPSVRHSSNLCRYSALRATRIRISRIVAYLERSPRYGFTNWLSHLILWTSAKSNFRKNLFFLVPTGSVTCGLYLPW